MAKDNEVYKLLDNGEIIKIRGDIPVDRSVRIFINLVFRGGKDKATAQSVTHEDILRLLKSTELYSYIEDRFPIVFIGDDTLLKENYWLTALRTLRANTDVVNGMFFFYGGVYISSGERKLFDFLKDTWLTHRNPAYSLSAIILLHLLGIQKIKESLC
jgi:hypothetical protein